MIQILGGGGWAFGSFKKDGTCSAFNPKDGTCEFELLNGFAGVEPNSPILKRQLELMAGAAAGTSVGSRTPWPERIAGARSWDLDPQGGILQ